MNSMQTIFRTPTQRKCSLKMHILPIVYALFTIVLVFTACKKELGAPVVFPFETGELTASEETIVINSSLPNDTAVLFKWDAYANPLINYTLAFTAGGKTDSVAVKNNTVSKLFSNSELNKILVDSLKLPIEVAADVQVELFGFIPTKGKTAKSNIIKIKVTPAKVGPAFTQLGIVGDATPKGWDIKNSDVMYVDPFDPYIFRCNEVLKAGEFKIPTVVGGDNWNITYYRPLTNDPDISVTTVMLADAPDNKWKITNPGPYKIELNILNNTIRITSFTPYTELWIVGNATPDNWNIGSPTPMVPTPGNPYEFTYTGHLNAGEFKIPTAKGNWNCDFFRPPMMHPPLTNTLAPFVKFQIEPENQLIKPVKDDFKWQISTAGNYKITLNQLYETIKIEQQ